MGQDGENFRRPINVLVSSRIYLGFVERGLLSAVDNVYDFADVHPVDGVSAVKVGDYLRRKLGDVEVLVVDLFAY